MTEMAELAERLQADLKDAMRAGDVPRREVLRFLRSEIHNVEIERGHPLSDDEIIDVISRQIKQRRDAIEQFRAGGRDDLADSEAAQVAILQTYLPPQLSYDELLDMARAIVRETGASGPRDMGKVVPRLREQVGARAEGSAIAQAAREVLAGGSESVQ